MADDAQPVHVVGLHGGRWFGSGAADALAAADVVVGAARLHDALPEGATSGRRVELSGPLDATIDLIEERRTAGERVVMLASGDPGFFGIERLLVGRFGRAVEVHPAPSSVALAFARARVHWDDAAVVSVHGRSLDRALPPILAAPKVAVLVSASTPPEAVGKALLAADAPHTNAWVCSRLGQPDESVTEIDIEGLAAGTFDPLSVLVLASEAQPMSTNAIVAWGRPAADYVHRAGMITKEEVRAAALAKLDIYRAATMWDVGAGSGSVAVEAARIAPGLRVYAIERNADDCARIRTNALRVPVTVVEDEAPGCFDALPSPDRVFIGGGGLAVLDAAIERLTPGGVIVATFAMMETALAAAERLGDLVQINVNRAVPIGPGGTLRLEAENPVFIAWGRPDDTAGGRP